VIRRAFCQGLGASALYAGAAALGQCADALAFDGANHAPKSDLAAALGQGSAQFQRTLMQAAELQIQICYSAKKSGWQMQCFRENAEWFAPASLVKLPLAAMALEQLEARGLDYRAVQISFPQMPLCAERAPELRAPQAFSRIIERALVLSDDSAYCALFDFLGPAAIATRFLQMKYAGMRVQARFGSCGPEGSRITGPWRICAGKKVLAEQAARPAFALVNAATPIRVGKAWMSAGKRIDAPKDFTNNNSAKLSELHLMLQALIDPASVAVHRRFALSAAARMFLLQCMQRQPEACSSCSAAERKFGNTNFRLLAVGDGVWAQGLQVCNKVGWAYGYLSDIAHLKHANRECIVSCVMYLNADGVLNDGVYQYDAIGRPFMAELGRLLLAVS
jgi:hypothetical protein